MKDFKGLSLVEVLIAITMAAVAGALLLNILVSSNRIFFNESVQVAQGLSLNQAALEITNLIKSSSGISNQYPPTGASQFTTDANTLVLKIPALNQDESVKDLVFDYAVISKDQSNPKILRKMIFVDNTSFRKSENKVLSTSLKQIKFLYLDVGNSQIAPLEAVRINFTINLSENVSLSQSESSASGTVNLK